MNAIGIIVWFNLCVGVANLMFWNPLNIAIGIVNVSFGLIGLCATRQGA